MQTNEINFVNLELDKHKPNIQKHIVNQVNIKKEKNIEKVTKMQV